MSLASFIKFSFYNKLDESKSKLDKDLSDYLQKGYDFSSKEIILLQNKLDPMTKEDKLILKMKFINGLTQQEIAVVLDTSVSTVNRRRNKILEALKKYVNEITSE